MTLIRIEDLCRERAWCVHSNDYLCKFFGCALRTLEVKLADAEAEGLIYRVVKKRGKTERIVIFLLKRFNGNLPVVDLVKDADWITEVVAGLRRQRRKPAPTRAQEPADSRAQEPADSRAQEPAPLRNNVVVEKDALSNNGQEEPKDAIPERQRREGQTMRDARTLDLVEPGQLPALVAALAERMAAPSPRAEAPAAAPAPPAARRPTSPADAPVPIVEASPVPARDEATAAFVATLSADERHAFDRQPEVVQRKFVEMHRNGVLNDPIIAKDVWSKLRPKPSEKPPPPPEGFLALVEQLPRGEPSWIQLGADDLVRDFGNDVRFRPAFVNLLTRIWQREHELAEKVVEAYRQAMKPASRNRGAIFKTALTNLGVDC